MHCLPHKIPKSLFSFHREVAKSAKFSRLLLNFQYEGKMRNAIHLSVYHMANSQVFLPFFERAHGGKTDRANGTKSVWTKALALFSGNFYKPQNPLEAVFLIIIKDARTTTI